ncbi:transcription factor IIA alpha/beta subunit [Mycena amicta]|nr:transcription factor IIA alpha/beta subunit [Mycena amicta]
MSNKISDIYRSVIDDVITSLKPEFEEYGVDDDVLLELQHKWETKMLASRVTDFKSSSQNLPASQHHQQQQQQHLPIPHYPTYVPPSAAQAPSRLQTQPIKPEPLDQQRFHQQYMLPPLPGPTLPAHLAFPSAVQQQQPRPPVQGQQMYRIHQVDGPSASDDEDEYDEEVPVGPYAPPRPAHPSVSVPAPVDKPTADAPDPEAITSDLDDSDTENEEDPEDVIETDIVFCTYDKVARVKNKWKCVLKDGMIHTGGKDYLFQRCTGEFEW